LLVDELAHANASDSRHPKRYMDVEELLAAIKHFFFARKSYGHAGACATPDSAEGRSTMNRIAVQGAS
jgi:Osmosensitive K+ channel His kinase sensor domain